MRHAVATLLFLLLGDLASAQYFDHRGYRLDSLENIVAGWTQERFSTASRETQTSVALAFGDLMYGYERINPDRAVYCARRAFETAKLLGSLKMPFRAARFIGQMYYDRERYDSTLYYYGIAQTYLDRMVAGEGGYPEEEVDDALSSFYGDMGNVYYALDSLPKTLDYYAKAGEIFEKNGWKQSSAILWHNMGDISHEQGNDRKAIEYYEKSIRFGQEADDSLWVAAPRLSLGTVYIKQGKVTKALEYLQLADEYYSKHQDQEYTDRILTLDIMGQALRSQKRQRTLVAVISSVLALFLLGFILLSRLTRRLGKANKAADEALAEALSEKGITIDEETLRYAQDDKTGALEDNNDACHAERSEAPDSAPELTQRELEILPMIAAGMTSKEIAARLFLTQQTIKWRRQRLLEKFDAKNTAEMLSKAREAGLL